MRIGVFVPNAEAFSMRVYRENITRELDLLGIKVVTISHIDKIPNEVDLYWDHQKSAGGNPPFEWRWKCQKPVVITLHGARPFVLAKNEMWQKEKSRFKCKTENIKKKITWALIDKNKFSYIAVSSYTKNEFIKTFHIPAAKITVVPHGVNHDIFNYGNATKEDCEPYLFHISQYQPVKNIDRLIAAYTRIPVSTRPNFILVASGYKPDNSISIHGLQILDKPVSEGELVQLYCNAIGFVFPSLHEGFGMPILEAMACGCPVITSNVTACPEVAGDAALLVNPRSVNDIADAIKKLIDDPVLRNSLREKGLVRAQQFTWHNSAREHMKVFSSVLSERHY